MTTRLSHVLSLRSFVELVLLRLMLLAHGAHQLIEIQVLNMLILGFTLEGLSIIPLILCLRL